MMMSEEKFRLLVKRVPIPLGLVNQEGAIIYVNDHFTSLFGYTLDDIPTLKDWTLRAYPDENYRQEMRKRWEAAVEKAARDGTDIEPAEYNVAGKNGREYVVEISGIIIGDNLLASFIDITARKRALEQAATRARQQAVVAELGYNALAGMEIHQLIGRATARVATTLGVEYCKVLELLPDGKTMRLVAGVGWKDGLVGQAVITAGPDSQAGFTLLSEKPVIVDDLRAEKRFRGLPLLHDHGVIGGISVIIGKVEKPFGIWGPHLPGLQPLSPTVVISFKPLPTDLPKAWNPNQRGAGRGGTGRPTPRPMAGFGD